MAKRILIADDERDFVMMLGASLRLKGYEVVEAYDGEETLRKARSDRPDIILLDVGMPKLDGFAIVDRMKEMGDCAGIPVVMVTGRGDFESVGKGMRGGVAAYISKPVRLDALLGIIVGLIGT